MTIPDRTPATWHLSTEQRRVALLRRLHELRAWQDRTWQDVHGWTFTFPGAEPLPLHHGQAWPQIDPAVQGGPVRFEASFTVPEGYPSPELELDVGGEGLVSLSTGLCGGLNPFHRRFTVEAAAGQTVRVTVDAVPKGLFGTPSPDPRLRVARLVQPEADVTELCLDLEVLLDAAQHLGSHDVVPHLLTAAEDALAALPWPSDVDGYLARLNQAGDMGSIWNPPAPPPPTPLPEEVLEGVRAARERLAARLHGLVGSFPPQGALALSGHAHLDLAWLWPLAETKRKAVRTFETVLHLMERFPAFTFNQSSAQLYAWIEEEHPQLFARIRARVQEGRWETVGGMWVEPDCAMSGGESLARQLLYGQRYFDSRFGQRSRVAWLPDTFGFTGALPQLLAGAGITGFFTTKLTWNESTTFPHDLWWWEGLDGTRVLAHSFKNDVYGTEALGSYNGDISAEHVLRVWRNDRAALASGWREKPPETLFTFGYGDGAGGPSAEMLRRFERLHTFPALPRLRHARVDDFYDHLPREGLPVWVGELYFQLHRGTLSSQGRLKRLHRQAEARLAEADTALALAHWQGRDVMAQRADLERHWKTHLLHEFHDILPGSSIREVYAEAEPALQGALDGATRLRDAALNSGSATSVAFWNPSLCARPLRGVLGSAAGLPDNLPRQIVEEGVLVVLPGVNVPPLDTLSLTAELHHTMPPNLNVTEDASGYWLNGDQVRVYVTHEGHLARVVTPAGREALGPDGHRLLAFRDLPRNWEAWDINADTQDPALGEELPTGRVNVVERGPLRVALRVERAWRGSRIAQTIRVTLGSARVDVLTQANWQERRTLLRACVDVNARSDQATFETAYGLVRRPTHRNQPSDAATFEGPGHRFADLSEPGFGLALLNDGRYGHSAYGSTLSLTLLRGPLYPDPLADVGQHAFTYSLLPHGGDLRLDGVLEAALDLNAPLIPVTVGEVAPLPCQLAGLSVALSTLKVAEDGQGIILRVYEPYGARGEMQLLTDASTTVSAVNLLEEPTDEPVQHTPQDGKSCWRVPVRPFQVLSFRLKR